MGDVLSLLCLACQIVVQPLLFSSDRCQAVFLSLQRIEIAPPKVGRLADTRDILTNAFLIVPDLLPLNLKLSFVRIDLRDVSDDGAKLRNYVL